MAITVVAASTVLVPVAALAAGAGGHPDRTNEVRQAIEGGKARNVILLLGDGMGDSEITIARNYAVGAAGRLALDTLPLTGQYTTYSLQEDRPNLPDYVTDSAAAGTAWATGHKTSNGRISTTAKSNRVLQTILERAQSAGYATGDVTTAELTEDRCGEVDRGPLRQRAPVRRPQPDQGDDVDEQRLGRHGAQVVHVPDQPVRHRRSSLVVGRSAACSLAGRLRAQATDPVSARRHRQAAPP